MASRIRVRSLLALLACLCALRPAAAQLPDRNADPSAGSQVAGVVYDYDGGHALSEVTVSLQGERGTIGTRRTDAQGRFAFVDVPPGTYALTLTLLGHVTLHDTLDVQEGADTEVVSELSISPIPLDPIVTVVPRRPLLQGFERRRKTGRGAYLGREEIVGMNAVRVGDLLRGFAGTSVVRLDHGGYGVRMRDGCAPSIWVNGVRTVNDRRSEIGLDEIVEPLEVVGIEVYRDPAAMPAQFTTGSCGAVLFWTRPAIPIGGGGQGSFWGRFLIVSGFVTLGLLLR